MKYRDHRGGLAESMATLREFSTHLELTQYVVESLQRDFGFTPGDRIHLQVNPYNDAPDTRIGWPRTCIVMVQINERPPFPVGFTDSLAL